MSQNTSLIIGRHPLIEAINNKAEIEKVLVHSNANGAIIDDILSLCKKNNIRVQYVPIEKLNQLTTKTHQGVIAISSMVNYYTIEDIIKDIEQKKQTPLLLILDNISDIRNIGAIIRTAYCGGVQGIIIPSFGVGALQEDTMKASAGALAKIKICKTNNLSETIQQLKSYDIQIISTASKTDKKMYDVDFNKGSAIILGSEQKGISSYVLKQSDEIVTIPILNNFDSLNVSAAAAVMIYEAVRQRQ